LVKTLYALRLSQITLDLLPCSFFQINKVSHNESKSGISFGGFLVFQCLLKTDTVEIFAMLDNPSDRVRE